jgi:hypothetical protein
MRTHSIAGLIILFSSGCGGGKEDESYDVTDQNLQGHIQGTAWEFVSGSASEGYEEGSLSITLYDVPPEGGDPCASGAYPLDRYLSVQITPELQDRELSFSEPAAFISFDGETIYLDVAVSGRLIIDEISDDTVSGGLVAKTSDSKADGMFSVPICP